MPHPARATLFPYTTLFRSRVLVGTMGCLWVLASGLDEGLALAGRERTSAALLELRSEEHTSELQSLRHLVCRLLLEKKNGSRNGHLAERQGHRKQHRGQRP